MEIVNVHKAKTTLSALIKKVLNGEKVIIASRGEPLVTLEKIKKEKKKRIGGQFKGKIWIAEDFDETPKDFLPYIK